jgi:hypothetical protein
MPTPQKKYQNSKKGRATKRAYFLANKKSINARKKEWRKKYPSKEKEYWNKMCELYPEKRLKKNFQSRILLSGITLSFEEYLVMVSRQKGVCAICKKINKNGRALAIDHCHKTGKVRGLLCGKCNIGIGLLDDDIKLLQKATKYLKLHL